MSKIRTGKTGGWIPSGRNGINQSAESGKSVMYIETLSGSVGLEI